MIKSMTGFSKSEATKDGISAIVEIKTLNGRYLEVNCRMPKSISHFEFKLRDMIKKNLTRGSVYVTVNIENTAETAPMIINKAAVNDCFDTLKEIRSELKIKETVKFDHLLHFSTVFLQKQETNNSEAEWELTQKAADIALKEIGTMRSNEGRQISHDIKKRIENVDGIVEKLEEMGYKKIPAERERLRHRVAQLFESDEIDEQRLQTELVLIADKLDISEECVRLKSHIKFFFEALNANEAVGKKINFLLQEMNREINTIGSKANDAEMSQLVVAAKEELERVREQIQNVE